MTTLSYLLHSHVKSAEQASGINFDTRMKSTDITMMASVPGRASHFHKRGRPCLLLAVLILLSIFALLGSRGLNEPDEGRYAEMGREMLEGQDWLVPTLHGFAHYQKPPIIYWLTAASLNAFGINEWAARLPSATAAVLTAWFTFIIGRRLFGERAGIFAAVVLVTSLEFFALARMLTADMVFTAWITGAITAFVLWLHEPEKRRWIWLYFAAMGMGFLTKGPMAFVVPVSAALGWQFGCRRQKTPIRIPWLSGMAIALSLGLSWFIIVSIRNPQLFQFFAFDELIARVATKQHGRYQPPWFFIPVLLVGMMPWTALLPTAMRWVLATRRASRTLSPVWWMLGAWLIVPFCLLSLSGSKLMTYVIPLFPALALTIGAWLEHSDDGARFVKIASLIASGFVILALSLTLAPRLFPTIIPKLPWQSLAGFWSVALILLLTPLATRVRSRVLASFALCVTTVWLLLTYHVDSWNRHLRTSSSMRDFARRIQTDQATVPIVFAYGVNAPGLEFYLGRLIHISKGQLDDFHPPTDEQKARMLSSPADCASLAPSGESLYGVIKINRLGRDFSTNTWRLVDSAGSFALIQKRETIPSEPLIESP